MKIKMPSRMSRRTTTAPTTPPTTAPIFDLVVAPTVRGAPVGGPEGKLGSLGTCDREGPAAVGGDEVPSNTGGPEGELNEPIVNDAAWATADLVTKPVDSSPGCPPVSIGVV